MFAYSSDNNKSTDFPGLTVQLETLRDPDFRMGYDQIAVYRDGGSFVREDVWPTDLDWLVNLKLLSPEDRAHAERLVRTALCSQTTSEGGQAPGEGASSSHRPLQTQEIPPMKRFLVIGKWLALVLGGVALFVAAARFRVAMVGDSVVAGSCGRLAGRGAGPDQGPSPGPGLTSLFPGPAGDGARRPARAGLEALAS